MSSLYENTKKDKRYSVGLEWCGKPTQQYVVRFLGDWVASFSTESNAWIGARDHNARRIGVL